MSKADNIYIVGFMGAGKSVVGKLLAEKLERKYYDTDSLIEKAADKTISELFEESGEEQFRSVESSVLKKVSLEKNAVISCGGGLLLQEENRKIMSETGTIIFLDTSPETLLTRLIKSNDNRPLLKGLSDTEKLDKIKEMLTDRLPHYRSSDYSVNSDDKSIEDVVNAVIKVFTASTPALIVELGERSYPIYIQQGISSKIGKIISDLHLGKKIAIVTDEIVSKLHLEAIDKLLSDAGFEVLNVKIPAGESSKSLAVMSTLYDRLLEERFERNSTVIALGGGVVGDLAGFAAATLLRGLNFVQVPTTLLAQVDSSVGGKVGINHAMGKNLIGSFYQPNAVIIDTDFLSTLPQKELMCGMAEVIKYGLILDYEFAKDISINFSEILKLNDSEQIIHLIKRCVELKAEVVAKDEQERGLRRILNFGHTFGHSIESVLPRGSITHGEAVAFGMRAAIRLSELLELLSSDQSEEALNLVKKINLPDSIRELTVAEIIDTMSSDKKVKEGEIHFVLLDKIGSAVIRSGIEKPLIEESIIFAQESI
ncbi:MAG: 3-dehydroquinate synthase [Candidatus Marinimicrobia bacterium]|nr:3-dehydroquinate synthase [Candidatus Neomarinimicrobiota bacterium]